MVCEFRLDLCFSFINWVVVIIMPFYFLLGGSIFPILFVLGTKIIKFMVYIQKLHVFSECIFGNLEESLISKARTVTIFDFVPLTRMANDNGNMTVFSWSLVCSICIENFFG